MDLRQMLKQFRETRNLSQNEASRRSGYPDNYLNRIERGKARPSRDGLIRLAGVLELGPTDREDLFRAADAEGLPPVAHRSYVEGPPLAIWHNLAPRLQEYLHPEDVIVGSPEQLWMEILPACAAILGWVWLSENEADPIVHQRIPHEISLLQERLAETEIPPERLDGAIVASLAPTLRAMVFESPTRTELLIQRLGYWTWKHWTCCCRFRFQDDKDQDRFGTQLHRPPFLRSLYDRLTAWRLICHLPDERRNRLVDAFHADYAEVRLLAKMPRFASDTAEHASWTPTSMVKAELAFEFQEWGDACLMSTRYRDEPGLAEHLLADQVFKDHARRYLRTTVDKGGLSVRRLRAHTEVVAKWLFTHLSTGDQTTS